MVRRPDPTEQEIHIACAEWLELQAQTDERYHWFFHCPNGGARHPATARMLKRMGVKPGVPDFLCPIPANGFNGIAVELKRAGGKPTESQLRWLERLKREGWRCAVCNNFDAFKVGVTEYFTGV